MVKQGCGVFGNTIGKIREIVSVPQNTSENIGY